MAFCKICACGEKIVFQRRMSYPENCPSCGRRLADFPTHDADDPIVNEMTEAALGGGTMSEGTDTVDESPEVHNGGRFCLSLPNGKCIELPEEECVVGRTEVGAEELSEYPSVSRRHLRIIPRRGGMLILEDLSSYGTLIDGRRMDKGSPERVRAGAIVTLCNVDARLIEKEE